VRDPRSSSYLITFEPAAQFGVLMAAEARRRGAERIRQLVFLGDGAAWIWNLATRHFPQATQIVDLYHAREHLHDLARLLEFMLGDHQQAWLQERLADLDNGDIPAICAAGRVFPLAGKKAADLDTALGYFEHKRPPDALRPLQEAGHVRRLRGSRGRVQIDRRAALQAVRDEMDGIRCHRHPHAALPGSQRPLGADPDPAHRKAGGLSRSGRR
jgi:hypothetical protein